MLLQELATLEEGKQTGKQFTLKELEKFGNVNMSINSVVNKPLV